MFVPHLAHHREECARVQLRSTPGLGTRDSEPFLQVFFIADQHVHILYDAIDDLYRLRIAAPKVPKLLAIVQVKRDGGAGRAGGLHGLDNQLASGLRKSRENAAAMEPANSFRKDRRPIKVAWLQLGSSFVGAIVKDHRAAHSKTAVAIDGGHVRTIEDRKSV